LLYTKLIICLINEGGLNEEISNSFLSILFTSLFISTQVFGTNNISIDIGSAYLKPDKTYNITVKDAPGTRLNLYTNDKNPISAVVNKNNWATFHKVSISNNTKISFVKIFHIHGKFVRKAINYTRYVIIAANKKVSFSSLNPASAAPSKQAVTEQKAIAPSTKAAAQASNSAAAATDCTNGSYINSAGNTVCNPETSSSTPSGATARCSDGTYSFSKSHRGTCSHHGGVINWF